MRKVFFVFSVLLLSVALAACGGGGTNDNTDGGTADEGTANEESTNETEQDNGDDGQANNDDQNNTAPADDMKEKMEELDYNDFELAVEYGADEEYEAELELKNDKVKAELEDEINNEHLSGQAAFDKIYPNVDKLTIDKNTDKEAAIAEVLDVFGLDDNYKEFELEITFSDGEKIEFEDRS